MSLPPLDKLEEAIGYVFKNKDTLKLALIHSSTNRRRKNGQAMDNERLEFLGDRVLGLVIADLLIKTFPKDREGDLARRHTALVRREALARVATQIQLGAHIDMIMAEAQAGGRENPAILANACEAVIAAMYMDGGLETASKFITSFWSPLMEEDHKPPLDSKTALQEWAQGRALAIPSYQTLSQSGPAHEPIFEIEVRVGDYPVQTATGPSKRKAEQAAAEALLTFLKDKTDD